MNGDPLGHARLRIRVAQELRRFVDTQCATLRSFSPELEQPATVLRDFVLRSGKRLRPAFCYWGWRAAGGPDDDGAIRAAASLELVHACALIHDDLIDASDMRRGQPAVHQVFRDEHRSRRRSGDATSYGTALALLVGDLALVWADALFTNCGLRMDAVDRARAAYDDMRIEVIAGQVLDVIAQTQRTTTVDEAMRVARYKSAKYTVERPLHVGALLAGADDKLLDAFSHYGLAVGEAFQLRDDVLGVFGDPSETGKPAGDDLRQGKRTVLVAMTLKRADEHQRTLVLRALGDHTLDEPQVQTVRDIITSTGALDAVEDLVSQRVAEGLQVLSETDIDDEARHILVELTSAATARRA